MYKYDPIKFYWRSVFVTMQVYFRTVVKTHVTKFFFYEGHRRLDKFLECPKKLYVVNREKFSDCY